ncbi:MAG TPA: Fic family protein, partial [Xanthomonadales bacterium]|nr:Fic family protein [Xanthomonadales bacterium]
ELVAPGIAAAQLLAFANDPAAEQGFIAVIERFPDDARAHLLFAEFLQNQGRLVEAGDYLQLALKLQPDLVENWTALAKIRLATGQLDGVIAASTQALELDIHAREARLTRAEAWRQAAQWQSAKTDYQWLLQSMPDNPYLLMGLGACLAGERAFTQALEVLGKALTIKPDLPEARLNIALVTACLGNSRQALAEFQSLLDAGVLPPALRDSARICQATLVEHQRLQPTLQAAGRLPDLAALQSTLQLAPPVLLKKDSRMVKYLQDLALACQQAEWPDLESNSRSTPKDHAGLNLPGFAEACFLSRAANDVPGIAARWRLISRDPPDRDDSHQQSLWSTWQAVKVRESLMAQLDRPGNGEAFLRCSHFRLFSTSAADFPGLFKFVPNNIGLHRTTVPECLVSTIRVLLDEVRPSIPPGMGRACFMLTAINLIHAFIDGNGRLARFVFCGELESAGFEPVLLLTRARKTLTDCLDEAQYRSNFQPFAKHLLQAHASTQDLLHQVDAELQAG